MGTTDPPTPDECEHPSPVTGVLAHEFAHYAGAHGPEGTRRTVTYYGPVVGGLPIAANHCEVCGRLDLRYPDGRREERRLFPGPQPGLMARAEPVDPRAQLMGRQARVSGLSVSRDLVPVFAAEYPVAVPRPFYHWTLPDLGVVDIISVLGLMATGVGLLISAVLAVYTYSTPTMYETEAAVSTGATFAGVLLLQIGAAAFRHFFPRGSVEAGIAVTGRGAPALDTSTRAIVTLIVVLIACLFVGGILATYDYATSGLEWPIVVVGVLAGAGALLIAIARALVSHFFPDDPD